MQRIAFAVAAIAAIFAVSPVSAQTVITQAKALAGNVTPGDTLGFPVTLSQPGAYRLESNLTVTVNQIGIHAAANNIDIDMNGFTMTGAGLANYGLVSLNGESRIHDGVINQFRQSGIYLRNNAWTIDDMQIVRNGGTGIDAIGARYITVRSSLVAANNADGVTSGQNLSIYDTTVSKNGRHGITGSSGASIFDSVVDENGQEGIILTNGLVSGNNISNNVGYGIFDQIGTRDTGIVDNILIGNNNSGLSQTTFTVEVHPNTCVGKPCVAP